MNFMWNTTKWPLFCQKRIIFFVLKDPKNYQKNRICKSTEHQWSITTLKSYLGCQIWIEIWENRINPVPNTILGDVNLSRHFWPSWKVYVQASYFMQVCKLLGRCLQNTCFIRHPCIHAYSILQVGRFVMIVHSKKQGSNDCMNLVVVGSCLDRLKLLKFCPVENIFLYQQKSHSKARKQNGKKEDIAAYPFDSLGYDVSTKNPKVLKQKSKGVKLQNLSLLARNNGLRFFIWPFLLTIQS